MAELSNPALDFSPLANLGQVHQKAQTRQTLAELGRGLSDGTIDYKQAAGIVSSTGDLDATTKFLALAQAAEKQKLQQQAGIQFSGAVGGIFGGQPPAGAQPQPQSGMSLASLGAQPPATTMPRATPVQSSPRVWGDQEAEAAGLYETPAKAVAQVAPRVDPAPQVTPQPFSGSPTPQIGPQHIPMLAQAVGNPNLPDGQKDLAKTLLTRALDASKPNERIQMLTQLKREGNFPGTILELEERLRAAGKTTVNVMAGEKEYDKQSAKEFAEMNRDMIKGAQSARMKISTLDRMGALLNDPNLYTGAGAEKILTVKRMANAIGIDVGGLSSGEAVKAIGNQFALELRNPAGGAGMPGALSDKDREFLQASVPGLQQTPEGNSKIIDYMKRVSQRSLDVERLRQDYVKKNGRLTEGFYRELEAFSNANPLFPEASAAAASGGGNKTKSGIGWSIVQ